MVDEDSKPVQQVEKNQSGWSSGDVRTDRVAGPLLLDPWKDTRGEFIL